MISKDDRLREQNDPSEKRGVKYTYREKPQTAAMQVQCVHCGRSFGINEGHIGDVSLCDTCGD